MEYILWIIGIAIGSLITSIIHTIVKPKTIGTIVIDQSDPDDKPYLFLELDGSISSLSKEKEVTLKVQARNYIPRV